jgi:hypothetical protein
MSGNLCLAQVRILSHGFHSTFVGEGKEGRHWAFWSILRFFGSFGWNFPWALVISNLDLVTSSITASLLLPHLTVLLVQALPSLRDLLGNISCLQIEKVELWRNAID